MIRTDAVDEIHRIGGGDVENLRLKPTERTLHPPGISVFKGGTAAEAAEQLMQAFPAAGRLQIQARTVGSATESDIRSAGFEVMPDLMRRFPNHHRIIHPEGVSGFSDDRLARLSEAFTDVKIEE